MGDNIKAETVYGRNTREALEFAEEDKDMVFEGHSAKIVSIRRKYKKEGWTRGFIYAYLVVFKKCEEVLKKC